MAALARMDIAAASEFLADDLVFTHVSALVDTKQSFLEAMRSGNVVYSALKPSEVRAQDFGNVVVLTGAARIDVTAKGTFYPLSLRFTDVWADKGGKWQMVAWHSTRVPDSP
jgi:ketosteroid isomerase-like protein